MAIWLKDHNDTSLVLKYRTRPAKTSSAGAWQNYQRAVRADGRQAIRILRNQASDLGLQPNKIGICGFSAGGHLAMSCSLNPGPKLPETEVSGMPDFAGLFHPEIPDEASQLIESRPTSESAAPDICPLLIVKARDDQLTPAISASISTHRCCGPKSTRNCTFSTRVRTASGWAMAEGGQRHFGRPVLLLGSVIPT